MRNADKAKFKQSNIERITNKLIVLILLFQILVSAVSAIGNSVWDYLYGKDHEYIYFPYDHNLDGFLTFLTYIVLNNTMIPISLIVSLEIVKAVQGYLIQEDKEMYCVEKKKAPKVFTSSINEELGQVQYIFSDKTGTLTCNKMVFKLCVIGNELFGDKTILEDEL
jgi:magnesium-transporting ATPase (P-type)